MKNIFKSVCFNIHHPSIKYFKSVTLCYHLKQYFPMFFNNMPLAIFLKYEKVIILYLKHCKYILNNKNNKLAEWIKLNILKSRFNNWKLWDHAYVRSRSVYPFTDFCLNFNIFILNWRLWCWHSSQCWRTCNDYLR